MREGEADASASPFVCPWRIPTRCQDGIKPTIMMPSVLPQWFDVAGTVRMLRIKILDNDESVMDDLE